MPVKYSVDVHSAESEMRRLEDGPDTSDLLRLESVLTQLFMATQEAVHVQTGSLKASGRIDSRYRNGVWRGEIRYGGMSPGSVHDPVRYSRQEQGRGGSHNFLRPVEDADAAYVRAMADFLKGSD